MAERVRSLRRVAPVLAVAAAALALTLLIACDQPTRVAGGASETEATVAGRVERPDGTPVAGAEVHLRPTYFLSDTGASPLPQPKGQLRVRGDAVTGADGSFRFDSVFPGNYALEARDGEAARVRLSASVDGSRPRQNTLPMVLASPCLLRGRVSLPATAKGGAYVRVYGLDRAVRTDTAGRFTLPALPAGACDLRVTPASPSVSPRTLLGILLPPGGDVDLGDIALAPSLDAEDYSAWGDSARITVDTRSAGVTGDAVDFPLLVRLDRSNFDFTASTGLDIRFADGRGHPLPYEIERWDPLAGKAEIWVRVDTLRGNDSAQSLTLYWNRPGASGRSEGPAVFDTAAGYQGAWHLARVPGDAEAVFRDASGRGNDAFGDGLDSAAPAAGISHLGQALDGVAQSLHTSRGFPGPDTFTVSLWFKTTALDGGKLIGFGGWQTGASMQNDRHVWMDTQGRIRFGVFPPIPEKPYGRTSIVAGTRAYNDGQWHYLAARLSPQGQFLFLDGELAASDATVTQGFAYPGFWRIGYDNFGAWDGSPRNYHFRGTLDEIRVTRAAWSDAFIRLSYENQKPGSGLLSLGR